MRTILIAAAALAATTARADGYKAMARDLSGAAKKAGVVRVAVMPFTPADGGEPRDGWNISEKLVTQLVRSGKVQALERSLLKSLMEEHRLGQSGALDPAGLKRLGKILSAQGIVTGSFVTIGREVVVNARLVDVETGVIVAASERRADRDWFDMPALYVPAPEFIVEAPTIVEGDGPGAFAVSDLRDSVAEDDCADAAERVDRLESSVLDLKARYWALQLKKGLDAASLKGNPGSTITDEHLKSRFYALLKEWHERRAIPELTPAETKRFVAADGRAFSLHQACGL